MPSPTSPVNATITLPLHSGYERLAEKVEALDAPYYGKPGLAILSDNSGLVGLGGGTFTPELLEEDELRLFGVLDTLASDTKKRLDRPGGGLILDGRDFMLDRDFIAEIRRSQNGHRLKVGVGGHAIQNLLMDTQRSYPDTLSVPDINDIWSRIPDEGQPETGEWQDLIDGERTSVFEALVKLSRLKVAVSQADEPEFQDLLAEDRQRGGALPHFGTNRSYPLASECRKLEMLGMDREAIVRAIHVRLDLDWLLPHNLTLTPVTVGESE